MAKCRVIACALWAIWTSRNRFVHEGEMKLGAQVAYFVINYLKELDRLNKHVPERKVHTARWVAPLGLRFKINFNVAFNKHRNELCSGLVALNIEIHLGLREVEVEEYSRKRETTYLMHMVPSNAEEAAADDRSWTKAMRETRGQRVEEENGRGFELI
ncbi:hypothetical protein GOBAR_AA00046 [Gossypium barbadense]|uniref:Uncharacterized protein n=1 Tax=Gossypium barbadense TaxID=3634 RepID=A0A2P5YYA0_GOSBA|nr:hypothetical protein GOBAR_AA00046 [Gossypium barbadense]